MQKILILSLLTLSGYSVFSQQQFIVRGTLTPCTYSGKPTVRIEQSHVTVLLAEEIPVHSHVAGKVVSVFKVDDQLNVIIKTNEDLYVNFGNLKQVNVKKGDEIEQSALIGLPLPGIKSGTWEVLISYDSQQGTIPCAKAIDMIRFSQQEKWVTGDVSK